MRMNVFVSSGNWSLLLMSIAVSDSESLSLWVFFAGGDCGVVRPDVLLAGERDREREFVVFSKLRRCLLVAPNVEYGGGPGTVGGRL